MARKRSRPISLEARDKEILDLRLKGWSQTKIAEHFGIGQAVISRALTRMLKEPIKEAAGEVVQLELTRLDEMFRNAYKRASSERGFDPRAIESCLKIMDRRAKFLGLDAPTKSETELSGSVATANVQLTEEQAQEIVTKLANEI